MKIVLLSSIFVFSCLYAKCDCLCVNGNVEAICSNAYEVRPVCTPRVCPIPPPSLEPLESPQLPPLGTTSCHQAQVYNESTRQYEWQRVCE